ncbi:MAG: hypothetical protein WCE21_05925 [Candidatus Babeliales bacterium]
MNKQVIALIIGALATVNCLQASELSDVPSFSPSHAVEKAIESPQPAAAVETEEPTMHSEMLQDENDPTSTIRPNNGDEMTIQNTEDVEKEA